MARAWCPGETEKHTVKTTFVCATNHRGARIKARALLDKLAADCERKTGLKGDHWRWADDEMVTGSILGPCYVHVRAPRVERGEA